MSDRESKYAKRLSRKREWYKQNRDKVANYNKKYYSTNLAPDEPVIKTRKSRSRRSKKRNGSRKSKKSRGSRKSIKTTSRSRLTNDQIDEMIKKLLILRKLNNKK